MTKGICENKECANFGKHYDNFGAHKCKPIIPAQAGNESQTNPSIHIPSTQPFTPHKKWWQFWRRERTIIKSNREDKFLKALDKFISLDEKQEQIDKIREKEVRSEYKAGFLFYIPYIVATLLTILFILILRQYIFILPIIIGFFAFWLLSFLTVPRKQKYIIVNDFKDLYKELPKWAVKKSKPLKMMQDTTKELIQIVLMSNKSAWQSMWAEYDPAELLISIGKKAFPIPSGVKSGIYALNKDTGEPIDIDDDPDKSLDAIQKDQIKEFYYSAGKKKGLEEQRKYQQTMMYMLVALIGICLIEGIIIFMGNRDITASLQHIEYLTNQTLNKLP